jgi:uncharacterized damage-inducible protein DinB
MTAQDLQVLYEYDSWANNKLVEIIAQLTPEQFTQSVAGAYGSVRNTMVHVLSAEWGWLDRCGGAKRGERLKPADYPTVETLTWLWSSVERHLHEFLSGLKDEDLARVVEYDFGQGLKTSTLGELMQHAAIHAVHHRGQVALLLRAIGVVPGNFDILFFYDDRRAVTA